jgi:hypothetical protein
MSYNFVDNDDPLVGKAARKRDVSLYSDTSYGFNPRAYATSQTEPVTDPLGTTKYPVSDTKEDNSTNAQKCGLTAQLTPNQISKLENYSVDVALFTAKQQQLAGTYRGMIVRDVIPALDFIDGNGATISGYNWKQPVSGGYTTQGATQTIYKTSNDVRNQFKVYAFWGVRQINSGPSRVSGIVDTAAILWSNPNVTALYDIWQVEGLDQYSEMYTTNPLIYGNKEPLRVDFWVKGNSSGQNDNFQLLGKVIEPLGQTIQGTPGFAKGFLGLGEKNIK